MEQPVSEQTAVSAVEAPVTPAPVGAIDTVAEWAKRRGEVADRRDGDGIEAAPEVAPEAKPAAGEPDPASEAGKELAKKKGSLQARIDEMARERAAAQAEAAAARAELEALRRGQQPAQPVAQPEAKPAEAAAQGWERYKTLPGAPDVNKFTTYEDYVLAVGVFVAQETAKEIGERQANDQRMRTAAEAMNRTHAAAVAEFPDFDAVVESFVKAGGQYAPQVQRVILGDSARGHKLAYALAKDPALNARLSSIGDPVQFGIELGSVLGGLTAKPAEAPVKPVSKAPAPIPEIAGDAPAVSSDPSRISSVAEWQKQRAKYAHAVS